MIEFGKPVKFNSVPEKVFASFPFPGAEEMATMFCFFDEYGYYGEKKTKRGILTFSLRLPPLPYSILSFDHPSSLFLLILWGVNFC